jgi:hypothetical protein
MMFVDDYPAEALGEIIAVLEGIEANPGANRDDMKELNAAYRRWRDLLRRDKLVDDNHTMHTFPRLTSHGRLFLLKHRRVASEGTPVAATPAQRQPARHSRDFCSVHWYGQDYVFAPSQAYVVKLLWEAWENATPAVHQQTLLDHVGSSMADNSKPRLRDLFRKHPAWGTMIRCGGAKGTYCLVPSNE